MNNEKTFTNSNQGTKPRKSSIASTAASSYSQHSGSSYEEQINRLCSQGSKTSLVLEEQYLIRRNKEVEEKIENLKKELASMEYHKKLAALESEYRHGKYTTAKRESELIIEIGKVKNAMRKLPSLEEKFDQLEILDDAIVDKSKEIKGLKNHIKKNQDFLKRICKAVENGPESPSPVKTIQKPTNGEAGSSKSYQRNYEWTTPAFVQPDPSQSKQKPSSSTQRTDATQNRPTWYGVKISNLPSEMSEQEVEDWVYDHFGCRNILSSSRRMPIRKVHIPNRRKVPNSNLYQSREAYAYYAAQADADAAVEIYNRFRLGYNVLTVEHYVYVPRPKAQKERQDAKE